MTLIRTDCQKIGKARTYRGLARMNADQKENTHYGDAEARRIGN
jgi:hypothetical protein